MTLLCPFCLEPAPLCECPKEDEGEWRHALDSTLWLIVTVVCIVVLLNVWPK